MQVPDLSVIVPVYNPPHKAFHSLCDSITHGGGGNFELIFVNDGSTDNFVHETLDDLSRRDERVRVINTENGGTCAARNIGIAAARGEYIAFADHDDEYLPGALQHMLDYAHKTNADVAMFGNLIEGRKLTDKNPIQHTLNQKEQCETILLCMSLTAFFPSKDLIVMHGTPWAKVFRRKMITENKLQFPIDATIREDNSFCIYAYDCAKTVSVDTTMVYHWHNSPFSQSLSIQPLSRAEGMVKASKAFNSFVVERHAGDKEFEAAAIIGTFIMLQDVDHRCLQPALRTPGNEREAWKTWHDITNEPNVKSAISRMRVSMLTHFVGWKREHWGMLFKAWLLCNSLYRTYFLLLVVRERFRSIKRR